MRPGDRVLISYMTGITTAEVVEVEPTGHYGPRIGWVTIKHVSDEAYGERYAGATYEASIMFMCREGEGVPPDSMTGFLSAR